MSKDEQGYNGWKNYETWVTKLWLDNDEGDYHECQERKNEVKDYGTLDIPQVEDGIWTLEEGRKFVLAGWIEEKVGRMIDVATGEASLVTDLVNSAISEIDFNEIAENMLSD